MKRGMKRGTETETYRDQSTARLKSFKAPGQKLCQISLDLQTLNVLQRVACDSLCAKGHIPLQTTGPRSLSELDLTLNLNIARA